MQTTAEAVHPFYRLHVPQARSSALTDIFSFEGTRATLDEYLKSAQQSDVAMTS
ncbi:hypothetical protein LJR230_004456 [Trinickia sp. LjRoot230]|uniref:hypothetical protein n=1 Tax=Trinickia sp. LjRoot230 TaxID=3342288 RepID=UPI003ED11DFC